MWNQRIFFSHTHKGTKQHAYPWTKIPERVTAWSHHLEVKNTWVHIYSNKQKSIYLLHVCIHTHTHFLYGFIYILKLLSLWYVIKLSWTLRTHQFFYTSSFVAFIFFSACRGSHVTPSSILYYFFFSPTPSQRLNLEIIINLSLNAADKSVEDKFGILLTYVCYKNVIQVGSLGQW